jgi:hypothetical protein
MTWSIVLSILIAPAVLSGLVLLAVRGEWVVRVSTWSILVQIALALGAWFLYVAWYSDAVNSYGDTCPDPTPLAVLAFGAILVGGIAAGSSTVSVMRHTAGAGRLLAGLAAEGLIVVTWIAFLLVALCGLD